MVSFCTAYRDRPAALRRLIASLGETAPGPAELVVTDFGAVPFDPGCPAFPVRVLHRPGPFNRSAGLNAAAAAAASDTLFFIDADMLVPAGFVAAAAANVGPGRCWFPVCYSFHRNRPREVAGDSRADRPGVNGWWRVEGKGMCGFARADFDRIGRWDERIGISYGGEDGDICRRAVAAGLAVLRDKVDGLFHVWHPVQRHHYASSRPLPAGFAVRP
jgi:glycosyltransferase involved in cell wall biosynthesis